VPFRYRFEKVLKYRIQKRDEQFNAVREAQNAVIKIQAEIDGHVNTINLLRKSMRSAPHYLMENYDVYIKHLNDVVQQLEEEKQKAIERLEEEKEKLRELEKAVNVLEKHKEKAREVYKEEEKRAEMKILDEVATQRYFAQKQERLAEELSEEERRILNDLQK